MHIYEYMPKTSPFFFGIGICSCCIEEKRRHFQVGFGESVATLPPPLTATENRGKRRRIAPATPCVRYAHTSGHTYGVPSTTQALCWKERESKIPYFKEELGLRGVPGCGRVNVREGVRSTPDRCEPFAIGILGGMGGKNEKSTCRQNLYMYG